MFKGNILLKLWLPVLAVFASWELALFFPDFLWFWFVLNLAGSLALAAKLPASRLSRFQFIADKILPALFCAGAFWWMLWIDFSSLKFVLPALFAAVIFFLARDVYSRSLTALPTKFRLSLFLGGTFFWAGVGSGLVIVLGWPLWGASLVFLGPFFLLSWSALAELASDTKARVLPFLIIGLLVAEAFISFLWLPFTETTISLLVVIVALFVFDMLKYWVDPGLYVRRIVSRKVLIYSLFFALVLLSTPWT